MQTATTQVWIGAPIERVFEQVTDHEGLEGLPGVGSATLLLEGDPERNGVGAVRELRVQGARFVEEVVRFDPPERMDYKIRECTLPLRHEIGIVSLRPDKDGTLVEWSTRFDFALPLIGRVLARVAKPVIASGFARILVATAARIDVPSRRLI